MYEYECCTCGAQFELRRSINQTDGDITCTTCGGSKVQRMFSVFAAVNKDSNGFSSSSFDSAANTGGSCCSGGSCGCSFPQN
jgi:putative FmdB family regulatory protein